MTFLRSPLVPGFWPAMGAVGTLWTVIFSPFSDALEQQHALRGQVERRFHRFLWAKRGPRGVQDQAPAGGGVGQGQHLRLARVEHGEQRVSIRPPGLRIRPDLDPQTAKARIMPVARLRLMPIRPPPDYIAQAIDLCISATPGIAAGVFNIGDSMENYTKAMIIDEILQQVPGGKVQYGAQPDTDNRNYRVSFDKAYRELHFVATQRVPDGIREIILALKNRKIKDPFSTTYENC